MPVIDPLHRTENYNFANSIDRISDDPAYLNWIQLMEPSQGELNEQRIISGKLPNPTLFSIITPTYNPPFNVFKDTAESVINQTYPFFEWCVADASSEQNSVQDYLSEYSKHDSRIKYLKLSGNFGISGNTNQALAFATGDYIVFLDHDDLLAPNALFEIASEVRRYPYQLIYSDEDRLNGEGTKRYDPCFRPGFSPEILCSNNYIPHLVTISKTLGDKVGWLNPDTDGAQDHDFLIRCSENTQQIKHIPKILYHWRAIDGSAALSKEAKPYSHYAGTKAVEGHLKRIRRPGVISDGHHPNYHIVTYSWPLESLITIILRKPISDHARINQIIERIINKTNHRPFEIIILTEGEQSNQAVNKVTAGEGVTVLFEHSALGVNQFQLLNRIINESRGDFIILIDPDLQPSEEMWLDHLAEFGFIPEYGVIGGISITSEKRIANAGYVIGGDDLIIPIYSGFPENWAGYFGMLKYPHDRSAFSDFHFGFRKSLFLEIGGYDEHYHSGLADIDFCLTVQNQGFRNIWTPYSRMLYDHQTSGVNAFTPEDRNYFQEKWSSYLEQGDPNYNPNLTLKRSDFSIMSVDEIKRKANDKNSS